MKTVQGMDKTTYIQHHIAATLERQDLMAYLGIQPRQPALPVTPESTQDAPAAEVLVEQKQETPAIKSKKVRPSRMIGYVPRRKTTPSIDKSELRGSGPEERRIETVVRRYHAKHNSFPTIKRIMTSHTKPSVDDILAIVLKSKVLDYTVPAGLRRNINEPVTSWTIELKEM